MSCDFAVWHRSTVLTPKLAKQFHEDLCDCVVRDVEPSVAVERFYNELTAIHPEIDDLPEDRIGDIEYCPWSIAFDRSEGHILISCVWPKAEYVARLLHDLAGKHALSVYDPQIARIVQPRPDGEPSDMVNLGGWSLVRESHSTLFWPSRKEIATTIRSMSASSSPWFSILQSANGSYAQAAGGGTSYTLEVRVGLSDFTHWVAGRKDQKAKPSVLRAGGQPIQLMSNEILSAEDVIKILSCFSNDHSRLEEYQWSDVTARFK